MAWMSYGRRVRRKVERRLGIKAGQLVKVWSTKYGAHGGCLAKVRPESARGGYTVCVLDYERADGMIVWQSKSPLKNEFGREVLKQETPAGGVWSRRGLDESDGLSERPVESSAS